MGGVTPKVPSRGSVIYDPQKCWALENTDDVGLKRVNKTPNNQMWLFMYCFNIRLPNLKTHEKI